MPRWSPDAESRLRDAAMVLFAERGYEAVTVSDIADRAALTRRTFFRHFPDKREVLYSGSHRLPEAIERLIDAAPPGGPFQTVVVQVLIEAGEALLDDPEAQRRRRAIIDSSAELRERERSKLADIASAISRSAIRRGVPEPDAQLTGIVMTAVLDSALTRALHADELGAFHAHVDDALQALARISSQP